MLQMKCPVCGETLKPSKKDPNYLLCYNCRKKYKAPQKKKKTKTMDDYEKQDYSNIPPKAVRDKREREMRRAYDELLAVEETQKKRKRRQVEEDLYDEEEDDEHVSKAPIIILGIAILIVAGIIVYMLLR